MSNHKYLLKQYNNDRIKKQKKEETEELWKLILKYSEQLQNFNVPHMPKENYEYSYNK